MTITLDTETAAIISAAASLVYAVVSAISLWLLAQQIRDARRFGAAPALYALLKELEHHMAAVRQVGSAACGDQTALEVISRCLEFFERIEHLRRAGVLPAGVLRRAFGRALGAYLADPRFADVIRQDARQYDEVLVLARHICQH